MCSYRLIKGVCLSRNLFTCTTRLKGQVKPKFEGTLPPKKYLTPYMVYCSEGSETTSQKAMKWRDMSPQDKVKYEEKSEELRQKYQKEFQQFCERFASVEDKKLYLKQLTEHRSKIRAYFSEVRERKKISRKPRATAFAAMKKHRSMSFPVEERMNYCRTQAYRDYKNLTKEELKMYQQMADTTNQLRHEGNEKKN